MVVYRLHLELALKNLFKLLREDCSLSRMVIPFEKLTELLAGRTQFNRDFSENFLAELVRSFSTLSCDDLCQVPRFANSRLVFISHVEEFLSFLHIHALRNEVQAVQSSFKLIEINHSWPLSELVNVSSYIRESTQENSFEDEVTDLNISMVIWVNKVRL